MGKPSRCNFSIQTRSAEPRSGLHLFLKNNSSPEVSSLIPPTGEVQAFYEDLNGRQYMNEVFNFSVDKLYDLLFTDSQFLRDFMEQRRFSGESGALLCLLYTFHLLIHMGLYLKI